MGSGGEVGRAVGVRDPVEGLRDLSAQGLLSVEQQRGTQDEAEASQPHGE